MLAIAYSGSFLMMEETAEKTEKTEKSEEALHSIYHGSGFQRTIVKKKREVDPPTLVFKDSHQAYGTCYYEQSNYNVDYIYFSSYLRAHV